MSSDGLEITVNHEAENTLVRLNGRVSIDSSPALRDQLLAILQGAHPEAVIVDLTAVPYIEASGIATLIEALRVARNRKTTLRLRGLHDGLLHLFEVTGVLSLFESYGGASTQSVAKVV
jgi:anti-sigma B factor antagonist